MQPIRQTLICLALILGAGAVNAAEPQSGQLTFNIHRQSLESALTEFGATSGLQVLFDPKLTARLEAPAVIGALSAEDALKRLLAGSDLNYEFVNARTVAIRAKGALPAADAASTASTEPGAVRLARAENATESQGKAARTAPSVQGVASDSAAESSNNDLQEIIVTGEKTTRSLFDTASAVRVVDDQELARKSITSIRQALDDLPNVLSTDGGGSLAPAVRGVDGTGPANGGNAFFAGERPRLNYIVDGRTLSYNEAIFTDPAMWDVNDVEVFLGPQSTLQGRNSFGGAIVINTKKPTRDLEGAVRVIGGNHDLRQASAALSGPIGEQVSGRISVDASRSQSYIDFTPYAGVDDPDRIQYVTARGKLLVEPTSLPGFSTLFTVSYSESIMPQNRGVIPPYEKHVPSFPRMNVFTVRPLSGSADSTWQINDHLSLTNYLSATDYDISRSGVPGSGIVKLTGREYVEEPRLRIAAPGMRLNGFVGLHFFKSKQDEAIDLFGGGVFDDAVRTSAIFSEITVGLTKTVDAILGGRLEEEHHERSGQDGPFVIELDETYRVFLPKAGLTWHVSDKTNVGVVASRGYNGGGAGFTFNPPFTNYAYDPEYVWNYEAFTRTVLFNNALSLSANVFLNKYDDMQLSFNLSNNPALQSVIIGNVPSVDTYGADVGLRYRVTPELQLSADVGLLRTKIHNTALSGIDGHELGRAPHASANLGISYLGRNGLELGIDARYSGGYFTDQVNLTGGRVSSFWIGNAQLAYRFEEGALKGTRGFVALDNISNSSQPLLIFPGVAPAPTVANLVMPRTIRAGLSYAF